MIMYFPVTRISPGTLVTERVALYGLTMNRLITYTKHLYFEDKQASLNWLYSYVKESEKRKKRKVGEKSI